MSEYKGTLEQADLDWIDGVVNDSHRLKNRLQRILNTIAELEAEREKFMATSMGREHRKNERLERQIARHESAIEAYKRDRDELETKHTALEFKAKAYDAMCDVGLIQFGDDPETRCYSVWGFGAWHHDPDILKAIAAAMEPPLLGKESEDG